MLNWPELSWRHRLIACGFLACVVLGLLLSAALSAPTLQEAAGHAAVGCLMLGLVLHPASFKDVRPLLHWQHTPPVCRLLFAAAVAGMLAQGVLGLLN